MIPRLVRFYGGSPTDWLERFPMAVVVAHQRMLSRLMAEESMRETEIVAMGSGVQIESDARDKRWAAWEREAGTPEPRAKKATRADLRRVGVGVRIVRKGGH